MNTEQTEIDGGPAFPLVAQPLDAQGNPCGSMECYMGMTLRDYACIELRVPRTGKPWLDEIIEEARRDAFAGQALVGELANGTEYCVEWRNATTPQT